MLLVMAVNFYASRVFLDKLGVIDYGIYNVVGGVVAIFSFFKNSMTQASLRYLSFSLGKNDSVNTKKVFVTCINVHLVLSFVLILFSETIGVYVINTCINIPYDRLFVAKLIYQISIFSAVITLLSVPYNALILSYEKMSAFALISLIEAFFKIVIVVVLSYNKNIDKLILYAVLLFLSELCIRFIYYFYCKYKFRGIKYIFSLDVKSFKEMFSFTGWTMFGNIAYMSYTQGLNILLNIFFGPTVNAARAIAVQVQQAISSFIQNFQSAVNPQIIKAYAYNEFNLMQMLAFKSSKYSFFILLILVIPIITKCDYVLSLWLKITPEYTASFIRVMLCISLIESLSNPLIIMAQSTGIIKKYQIIISSILVLIIPISYVTLLYFHQPIIVFIVQLVVVFVTQNVRFVLVKRMLNMSGTYYLKNVIYPISIVTIITISFSFIASLYFRDNLPCFIFYILFQSLFTLFIIYLFGIDKTERKYLINILLKQKNK